MDMPKVFKYLRCPSIILNIIIFLAFSGCDLANRPDQIWLATSPSIWMETATPLSCQELLKHDSTIGGFLYEDETVKRIWAFAQNTEEFTEIETQQFNARVCMKFYNSDYEVIRTVGLSFLPVMQIDGKTYRTDPKLYKVISDELGMDFFRIPILRITGDASDEGFYICDAIIPTFYDSLWTDIWRIPSENPLRIPASILTGMEGDEGYFYYDQENEVIRNQDGKIADW